MAQNGAGTRIPISLTHGCLVASIQIDLDDTILADFRHALLERLRDSRASGVVLDLSGVDLLDAEDFEALRDCIRMASLMGARSILVGLSPGIVSALVDMDVETGDVEATLDLEEALDRLRPGPIEGNDLAGALEERPEAPANAEPGAPPSAPAQAEEPR